MRKIALVLGVTILGGCALGPPHYGTLPPPFPAVPVLPESSPYGKVKAVNPYPYLIVLTEDIVDVLRPNETKYYRVDTRRCIGTFGGTAYAWIIERDLCGREVPIYLGEMRYSFSVDNRIGLLNGEMLDGWLVIHDSFRIRRGWSIPLYNNRCGLTLQSLTLSWGR